MREYNKWKVYFDIILHINNEEGAQNNGYNGILEKTYFETQGTIMIWEHFSTSTETVVVAERFALGG